MQQLQSRDKTTSRPTYLNEGWTSQGIIRKMWAKENKRCAWCGEHLPKGRTLYCSQKCGWRFFDDPGYHNRVYLWTRIRAEVLWENKVCKRCGIRRSSEVDHIKEVALGGDPFDKTNLQALCHQCHKEKTALFLSEQMREDGRIRKRLTRISDKENRVLSEFAHTSYAGAPVGEFFTLVDKPLIDDFSLKSDNSNHRPKTR